MATFIEQIDSGCPGASNSTQLRNYLFYKRVQKLLARCPGILDEEDAAAGQSVSYAFAQIECGLLFEEFPLMQYEATLARFEVECEQGLVSIIASGIYTSSGTATTQDIAIPGVLPTDVVTVTLHTQAGSELVEGAVAGTDEVTVTFTAAPTAATKVNYTVTRP